MSADCKYGFIGGGNMGEALIMGLLGNGATLAEDIMVHEVIPARQDYLEKTYKIRSAESNSALVKSVDIIILAVKPQFLGPVLTEIGDQVNADQLVVSIIAGVKIEEIQSALPEGTPVIRTMPNTPALVMAGATAMAPGDSATDIHMASAREIFESVGIAIEVPEKHMDIVTGLSGSGPAYIFMIMEAMADAGVLKGLPMDQALLLAGQTIFGSAKLAVETGVHPAQLKNQVSSPGGTTIAGLKILETGGLRGLIMEAIEAATNRSIELGRGEK